MIFCIIDTQPDGAACENIPNHHGAPVCFHHRQMLTVSERAWLREVEEYYTKEPTDTARWEQYQKALGEVKARVEGMAAQTHQGARARARVGA